VIIKRLFPVIVCIFLFFCPAEGLSLQPGNISVFQLGSDRYFLAGTEYTMDALAFMEQNRAFVPVRYLALVCGLKDDEIIWDGATAKVTLTHNGRSLTMQVGNRMLDTCGTLLEAEAVPEAIGGRVYLPARQVAEFFDYQVSWDEATGAVLIYPPGGARPEPPGKIDLLLVNKAHPMPKDFHPGPLAVINNRQISQQIKSPLQNLLAAARDKGYLLTVNSGYRSYQDQNLIYSSRVKLYGRKSASFTVALPGHSEHQTGLAVGLKGSAAAYAWLEKNCWHYGFILRYPAGKQVVTGFAYEPWHYRYVGITVATFMHDKKISTLEEYASYIMLH